MEKYDAAKATRVWQRVQGSPAGNEPHTGLPALIAEELQNATVYQQLARRMGPKDAPLLRRLHEEDHAHADCLKGIYNLVTGEKSSHRAPPVPQESPDRSQRRCYGQEMRCLAQYEARSTDPEYGPVFSRLAAQEREHCRIILELLGRLQK